MMKGNKTIFWKIIHIFMFFLNSSKRNLGTYASMLPQKKTNFLERFRKESEYAETPC